MEFILLFGKPESTPAMKAGCTRHAKLEEEVYLFRRGCTRTEKFCFMFLELVKVCVRFIMFGRMVPSLKNLIVAAYCLLFTQYPRFQIHALDYRFLLPPERGGGCAYSYGSIYETAVYPGICTHTVQFMKQLCTPAFVLIQCNAFILVPWLLNAHHLPYLYIL